MRVQTNLRKLRVRLFPLRTLQRRVKGHSSRLKLRGAFVKFVQWLARFLDTETASSWGLSLENLVNSVQI